MRGHMFWPFGGDQVAVVGLDDSRHDASCFADEIAIDFPSVAPAVDRMRRAFIADERSEALCAAITLSIREAREGTTIPLEVPVRCTCHTCGGRGETWTEACRPCRGSGFEFLRHQLQVLVPAGVSDGTRFCFTVTPRHHPSTRIELQVQIA